MFKHWSFDAEKNKLDCYRAKGCMKNFCLNLRKHATKIISYEKEKEKKKKRYKLSNEESKSYKKQKVCHICKNRFSTDDDDDDDDDDNKKVS